MPAKSGSRGLFLFYVPLDSEKSVVPHSVVPPQPYPNLGFNIDSETSFLLRLKSWEAECFGNPSPLVSHLPRLALGLPDQGPPILMSTHPHGGDHHGPPEEEKRWWSQVWSPGSPARAEWSFRCRLFGTPTLPAGVHGETAGRLGELLGTGETQVYNALPPTWLAMRSSHPRPGEAGT